ncbi:hypothetical protein SEPCBS57363_001620 [Sporothrix epigloea]|uniref:DUF7729 domain-containing protein n=1 Tax=Sporothrix epigloea TaxID=1892477 RepID=A0ABP0DD04_9PEZI
MAPVSLHKPRAHSWRCTAYLSFVTLFSTFYASTIAAAPEGMIVDATLVISQLSTITGDGPAAETFVRDDRMPILRNGDWAFLSHDEVIELRKRDDDLTVVTTAQETTTAVAQTKTTTTDTTRTKSASPLPSFFDSSLGSNFSADSACPSFISAFLTNSDFKKCYPFSLLIQVRVILVGKLIRPFPPLTKQGSRSFFEAEKSLVTITQVLDATCAANATFCGSYLEELAANLTDSANCGRDYALGNPIVVQAYLGMTAYQPLYAASCLTDPGTGAYCFANAITNLTTTANAYFYYLPLNNTLPTSGSEPSCNWCLQQTMTVFWSASANRHNPIANTYLTAAQQVDTICGAKFVNSTLPAAISGTTSLIRQSSFSRWLAPTISLCVLARHVLF